MKKLTKTDKWALAIIVFFAVFIVTLILTTSCQSQNEIKAPGVYDSSISVLQLDSLHRTGGYVEYYLSHPLVTDHYFKFRTRGPKIKFTPGMNLRITPEIRYSKYYPLMMVKGGGKKS